MGNNSIRDTINKEDQISTIRLLLSADYNHKLQIIVVEGPDDCLFCSMVLDKINVQESFSGKHGVYEIVDFFNDKRVIGICDLDYDTGKLPEKIFYYDYSCLEMMMVSNDKTFESVYTANCIGWKSPLEARDYMLSGLAYLSRFRKINSVEGLGINFNGISISSAFNQETGLLDNQTILEQLNNCNKNPNSLCCIENIDKSDYRETSNYYDITQGHDFLRYFQTVCANFPRFRKDIPNTTTLLKEFVLAFKTEFISTDLYGRLAQYGVIDSEYHDVQVLDE